MLMQVPVHDLDIALRQLRNDLCQMAELRCADGCEIRGMGAQETPADNCELCAIARTYPRSTGAVSRGRLKSQTTGQREIMMWLAYLKVGEDVSQRDSRHGDRKTEEFRVF